MTPRWLGGLCGLLAALIYGGSFALTKHVQSFKVGALILGSLVYFSQAAVFLITRLCFRVPIEKRVQGPEWKWVIGAALFGGFLGPMLYFKGQESIPAYVASLLAPTEILFTTLIAVLLFRERLSRFESLGMVIIVAGAAVVGLNFDDPVNDGSLWTGAALVLAAYLMWGADNNCTTRVAHRDPLSIAIVKGLVGGLLSLIAGIGFGQTIPTDPKTLALIFLLGVVFFGISYVIFILSMRLLGAARATALFGTNPVFAVTLAWTFLQEEPSGWALAGGAVVISGVYLMLWAGTRRTLASAPPSGTKETPS